MAPEAARAQFFDLDGVYRCVTAPDPACAAPPAGRPAAPAPVAKDAAGAQAAAGMGDAIARVKQGAASADDIRLIEARAAAKDPRAVEVLAWCKLNGIGMAADAVGAYWLYREAAGLGIANARANQIAIYETRLSSEQRHQVLLKENDPDR